MELSSAFKNVVWAVDPLVKDKTFQEVVPHFLKAFFNSTPNNILPASVILESQIPYLVGPEYTPSDFKVKMEASLNQWLGGLALPHLSPASLLMETTFSVKAATEKLIAFAKSHSSNLIVCTTHAKPREHSQELGTFSENLFLNTNLPLLLIHPQSQAPKKFQEFFFPTDISSVSIKALNQIKPIAKSLKAHITLFHKSLSFTKDVVDFPFSSDVRSRYVSQRQMEQILELNDILKQLREEEISSDLIVDSFEHEYVAKSIVAKAESFKNVLIAMASHSHHNPNSIPGSVTRQVLRSTKLPLWVLHPQHPIYQ